MAIDMQTFSGGVLDMSGVQYSTVGQMNGMIFTSDPIDPTLTISTLVINATGNPWLGYQVNVIMDVPFLFGPPGPTVNNPPINDWFVAALVAPTLQSSGPHAGNYEGTLWFSEGTPVGVGGELDFLYSIQFGGSTGFSFTQEMIPWYTQVPEPNALALMGLGGLGLLMRLSCKGRQTA